MWKSDGERNSALHSGLHKHTGDHTPAGAQEAHTTHTHMHNNISNNNRVAVIWL